MKRRSPPRGFTEALIRRLIRAQKLPERRDGPGYKIARAHLDNLDKLAKFVGDYPAIAVAPGNVQSGRPAFFQPPSGHDHIVSKWLSRWVSRTNSQRFRERRRRSSTSAR